MEIPASLREAVEAALEGVPLDQLRKASDRLTARYRSETRDGALHLADDLAARAYLAVRMPATYAAIRALLRSQRNCVRTSRRAACSMLVQVPAPPCSQRAIAGPALRMPN